MTPMHISSFAFLFVGFVFGCCCVVVVVVVVVVVFGGFVCFLFCFSFFSFSLLISFLQLFI